MRERLRFLDTQLLLPMVLLVVMGTLTIYSAGRGTSQSGLWLKQTLWNFLGFLALATVAAVNPPRIFRSALALYILGLVSLVAVLGIGHQIGGAQRWLVFGHLTWQPSELMKWLTLLFVAHRLGTRPLQDISTWDLVGCFALVLFPMLLVLRQPDLGMAISFLPILLLIPLLKGLRLRWVLAVLLHTLWDDSLRAGAARIAVVYVILLGAFVVLLVAMVRDRRRIVGLMRECLKRFQDPAVMTADDVKMLSDLRDRRIARQWARLHCGLRGGETMAGYQLTATELALAYDRAQHGQMEPDAFDIRRERSLDAMRQAAAVLRGRQPRPPQPSWAPDGASAISPPRPHRPAGRPRSRPGGADSGPTEEDDD